jgi:diacylglycerol kinase (ATP)
MESTRTKVIVNPAAGAHSTHRKWPSISSLLKKAGLKFDYQFTEGKGHGIELAKAAANNGYSYLVAVGGDGTIHEVANGIMQTQNAKNTSLGIVSTGTGSDLSRTIGIPTDYTKACSSITSTKRLIVDMGLVEYTQNGQPKKRYFINSAGIGFDAETVAITQKLPKFLGGTLPYLTGLFASFLGYRNKAVTLIIGDNVQKTRILTLVVANGGYFGGGMHIAPEAKVDDNLLDVVVIGNISKIGLLKALPSVYKGTHLSHPLVKLEKATHIRIESKKKFLVQADGEILGEGPASFDILPAALSLVI